VLRSNGKMTIAELLAEIGGKEESIGRTLRKHQSYFRRECGPDGVTRFSVLEPRVSA
jgi:hypothetical protein